MILALTANIHLTMTTQDEIGITTHCYITMQITPYHKLSYQRACDTLNMTSYVKKNMQTPQAYHKDDLSYQLFHFTVKNQVETNHTRSHSGYTITSYIRPQTFQE
jgi:hypothetical protein